MKDVAIGNTYKNLIPGSVASGLSGGLPAVSQVPEENRATPRCAGYARRNPGNMDPRTGSPGLRVPRPIVARECQE